MNFFLGEHDFRVISEDLFSCRGPFHAPNRVFFCRVDPEISGNLVERLEQVSNPWNCQSCGDFPIDAALTWKVKGFNAATQAFEVFSVGREERLFLYNAVGKKTRKAIQGMPCMRGVV